MRCASSRWKKSRLFPLARQYERKVASRGSLEDRAGVGVYDVRIDSLAYQATQRFSGGLTMADPALQSKAFWNSGEFDSGPITRYLAVGCGSVLTI